MRVDKGSAVMGRRFAYGEASIRPLRVPSVLLGSLIYLAFNAAVSMGAPLGWNKAAQNGAAQTTVQGKLQIAVANVVKVATSGGTFAVTSGDPSLLRTLQDTRLSGRDVRLEGERKPDGSFDVRHLYTVRDGKLFRIRYYCHVCNIAATEPGNCVCCQRPTDLEEIPVEEVTDDMVTVP